MLCVYVFSTIIQQCYRQCTLQIHYEYDNSLVWTDLNTSDVQLDIGHEFIKEIKV